MPQDRILEGKVAIITGAGRGIGAAICENLASKGANLVMNFTSPSSEPITKDLAKQLESTYNVRTLPVKADIGSVDGPADLIREVRDNFSKLSSASKFQIDIIINNAGLGINYPISDVTEDAFDKHYHVNVRGPLFLIKAAEPHLPHDRSGRIVNVSSVSSTLGLATQSIYGGTKAALEAMTRTWARELSERATCNAVNPGPVATDMWDSVTHEFLQGCSDYVRHTPLARARDGIDDEKFIKNKDVLQGRPAYPHEIAGVVGMLCTPEAGFTTGSTVCANGGMVMTN